MIPFSQQQIGRGLRAKIPDCPSVPFIIGQTNIPFYLFLRSVTFSQPPANLPNLFVVLLLSADSCALCISIHSFFSCWITINAHLKEKWVDFVAYLFIHFANRNLRRGAIFFTHSLSISKFVPARRFSSKWSPPPPTFGRLSVSQILLCEPPTFLNCRLNLLYSVESENIFFLKLLVHSSSYPNIQLIREQIKISCQTLGLMKNFNLRIEMISDQQIVEIK